VLLAQISDLHLDGTAYPADRARRVMEYLLAASPDALLVTGDIADHGAVSEYEEAAALLVAPFPILTCPGNHDVRGAYRKVLLGEPESDAPINRAHRIGDLTILMCDSSVPGRSDGLLDPATLAWIDTTLSAADRALLAMHHHPVPVHHPALDAIPLRNPADLAATLSRHPAVSGVLVGHAHLAAASSFAGRPLVVAPSVTYAIRLPWESDQPADRDQPPGIALHFLSDDGLFTRFKTVL
jgi:Icc protein